MIFCHTRKTASWLAEKMRKDGHAVCLLSGELTVDERILVGHQTAWGTAWLDCWDVLMVEYSVADPEPGSEIGFSGSPGSQTRIF
jgi:hypothetical protein